MTCLTLAFLLSVFSATGCSSRDTGSTGFRDDAAKGHLTWENDEIKVVWHYRTNSEEHNNQGGGNIYELYDKQTDPGMRLNIASLHEVGTVGTTPPMAGVGGLGATHLWERGTAFAIADNTATARLTGLEYREDEGGIAVVETGFIVPSLLEGHPDTYRVDKRWEVHPGGRIRLSITMEMARAFELREPAYDFSFNRDYGWTQASSFGHSSSSRVCSGPGSDGPANPANELSVMGGVDTAPDTDYQLLHSERFRLYGQPEGTSVTLGFENGFEAGGLFALGYAQWGSTGDPTVEYSDYGRAAHGHTVHYYGWWFGDESKGRYGGVEAGQSWSDTLWIELGT